MAGNNSTSDHGVSSFQYHQYLWGDCIYGTKAQLQSIGIAVGAAFPGEPGGPRRRLRVSDSRRFQVTVEESRWDGESVYCASIHFPGREHEHDKKQWTPYAPGVRTHRHTRHDEYVGTAVALAAAGLVRLDQLPGQPGMRKTIVTILPDGSLPVGAPTANCSESYEPGAKKITRASRTTYRVRVSCSEDIQNARWEEEKLAKKAYEARMRALPRPAPLIALRFAGNSSVMTPAVPKYRSEGNVIYLPCFSNAFPAKPVAQEMPHA